MVRSFNRSSQKFPGYPAGQMNRLPASDFSWVATASKDLLIMVWPWVEVGWDGMLQVQLLTKATRLIFGKLKHIQFGSNLNCRM